MKKKNTRQQWIEFWDSRAKKYENPIEIDGYTEQGDVIDKKVIFSMKEDIRRKMELSKNDSILEVGCGTGMLLEHLSEHVLQFSGTDISEHMITKAKNLLHSDNLYVCEAFNLPFEDNTFDKVLCYSVFHYFPDVEYAKKVIIEFIRVIKPNGIILIGDVPDKNKERNYSKYLSEKKHNFKQFVISVFNNINFFKSSDRLEFIFYEREFFINFTNEISEKIECEILEQNYKPSRKTAELKLRFDVKIGVK